MLARLLAATAMAAALAGCGTETPPTTEASVVPSPSVATRAEPDPISTPSSSSEEVGYHNPNTGYSADYVLDVEYGVDGQVERINFENGGWEDDFVDQHDNGDGTVTVTDEDGREFTVASREPDAEDDEPEPSDE